MTQNIPWLQWWCIYLLGALSGIFCRSIAAQLVYGRRKPKEGGCVTKPAALKPTQFDLNEFFKMGDPHLTTIIDVKPTFRKEARFVCMACGAANSGANVFYCRKCGKQEFRLVFVECQE